MFVFCAKRVTLQNILISKGDRNMASKMPAHSNAMPAGKTISAQAESGRAKAFGHPGGPAKGVSPMKGTGQSLVGHTTKMGAAGGGKVK